MSAIYIPFDDEKILLVTYLVLVYKFRNFDLQIGSGAECQILEPESPPFVY